MELALTIAVLIALSAQVLPVAVGIDTRKKLVTVWYSIILVAGQVFFLFLGMQLGMRFMYLLEKYLTVIMFAGFFMIGLRMLVDVFKIRKGERTYYLENTATLILAAVAQGVNTFLAGLLLIYAPMSPNRMLFVVLAAALLFTLLGILLKPAKQSFAISAFLFFLSAIVMLVAAVYVGFFNK